MSRISAYNFDYKLAHIDLLSEYEILHLLEYAGENNKWKDIATICDYISHHGSIWLCQCLNLPCNEKYRYQPSCVKDIGLLTYYSYKI